MKNRNLSIYCALWMFTAAWWGLLYPQFMYTQDTYSILDEATGRVLEAEYSKEEFLHLLDTSQEKVQIKSKLLEEIFSK